MPMGGQLLMPIRFYLFGKNASEVAKLEENRFGQWITEVVR